MRKDYYCPNCGSTDWKSAELVVLEGTSSTEGQLAGKITEYGRLEGGVSNFLLSDRWFTYNSAKIDGDIKTQTISGLASKIQKVLASHSESIGKLPILPDAPKAQKKPGCFGLLFALNRPFKNRSPTLQEPKEVGRLGAFWHRSGAKLIIWLFLLLFWEGIWTSGFDQSYIRWFFYTVCGYFFLSLVWSPSGFNEKRRKEAQKRFDIELDLHKDDQATRGRYDKFEKELAATRKIDLNRWKEKRRSMQKEINRILKERKKLWAKTRVCMRCGDQYFCERRLNFLNPPSE